EPFAGAAQTPRRRSDGAQDPGQAGQERPRLDRRAARVDDVASGRASHTARGDRARGARRPGHAPEVSAPVRVNILLVEDHRLMFEGLSAMLSEYPDLNVLGVATTVADAVEKCTLLKPDLVLMDYRLPDGDGAVATERIRTMLPETAVLFLSAVTSESAQAKAIQA